MKRTSIALLLMSLTGISSAADQSPFPSAAQEFPPIISRGSFMDRHRDSALTQPVVAGPSSAVMWDPIRSNDTYMLRHLDSIDSQRSIPFPSSPRD
jgi:hypothetical protein